MEIYSQMRARTRVCTADEGLAEASVTAGIQGNSELPRSHPPIAFQFLTGADTANIF